MGIPKRVIPLVAAALALLITVLYVSISSDIGQEQWLEPTNAGMNPIDMDTLLLVMSLMSQPRT